MKVLQLNKFYPPVHGGMEATVWALTEGLNAAGVATDVLCANRRAVTECSQAAAGYSVVRAASLGMLLSTSMAPALVSQLRRMAPGCDVIHVHMPDPMAALALRLVQPRARLVVHWHSDVVRQRYARHLYGPLQSWLLDRADAIIATSSAYADSSQALQRWRAKVSVIPIGIEAAEPPAAARVAALRARHAGRKIIFALGRMSYYKGFEVLIEAAASLPADCVVLIGGAGELLERHRAQAAALPDSGRVQLLGPVADEELGTYFAAADVFCLPSVARSEAFGVVMLEAMALGKPLVATDIAGSGVPWVNQHGVTGLNVPVSSPGALAGALTSIVHNPGSAQSFGQAARKRYEDEFTATLMTRRTLDLYRRLTAH
jgi:glycosyltransferase involved in cell wall biosynthesis